MCFALANRWFDCEVGPEAAEQIGALSEPVAAWLDEYSGSPLMGLFEPNKDEMWLHLSLLDSRSAKVGVVRRRLLPGTAARTR